MNKYVLAAALALISCSVAAESRGGIVAGSYNYFNSDSGAGMFSKSTLPGVDPAGVAFVYQVTSNYSTECTWTDHTRTRYPITHTDGANVNSSLMYINGGHQLFAGYSLNGFGTTYSSGATVPVIGTQCKKGRKTGTYTAVDLMSSSGGLYANYGTSQTLIY